MNVTTVYKNEMNLVPLKNFTSAEIDLFFAICTKLKNEGTKKVKYNFSELKTLSDYYSRSLTRFIHDLEKVYDKMLRLTYTNRNEKVIQKFVLFTTYKIDIDNEYLEISVNPELEYILNNLTGNFTKFELQELTQLKSSHSKNMFRLLKQFKSTGYYKVGIDEFRERLDIPQSYRMSDIDKKVFKYIRDELPSIFINLQINKIKGKRGKVEYLEFHFEKENNTKRTVKPNTKVDSYEMTPQWLLDMKEGKERKEKEMSAQEKAELEQKKQELIKEFKKMEEEKKNLKSKQ
ncbi:replication initiation protein [Macrococcus armenti]|uniref:replication initiation protein n=1 Tax=Macrococcus armenti TaxID=2875764 RepID=UPI001CC993F8|nr:RepB family plasmid replication initiator protein [Macrococcus armenti]UBH09794.1 RepB family plasmid replication initiator protein [Macrococcus armenti]